MQKAKKTENAVSENKKENFDISGDIDGCVLDVIGSILHILMILSKTEQMQGI